MDDLPKWSDEIKVTLTTQGTRILTVSGENPLEISEKGWRVLQLYMEGKSLYDISTQLEIELNSCSNMISILKRKGYFNINQAYPVYPKKRLIFPIFEIFSVNADLPRLSPFLEKILFNPKFMSFVIILFILTFYFNLFYPTVPKTNNNDSTILIILSNYLLITTFVIFHEYGHYSASRYYGFRPTGLGMGLYMFVFICGFVKLNEIYHAETRQKLIINSAGLYFGSIYILILFILSIIFENQSLYAISIVMIYYTIFNLIPFFNSDGFWIIYNSINNKSHRILFRRVSFFISGLLIILTLYRIIKYTWHYLGG